MRRPYVRHIRGDVAEAKVVAFLVEQGFHVSRPINDKCPYDAIADDGEIAYRIEIKSVSRQRGSVGWQESRHASVSYKRYTGGASRFTHEGPEEAEADIIIAYDPIDGALYGVSGEMAVGYTNVNFNDLLRINQTEWFCPEEWATRVTRRAVCPPRRLLEVV